MEYGILSTEAVICFLLILVFVYTSKPQFKSAKSTTFKYFVLFAGIHCISQILAFAALKYLETRIVFILF